MDQARTQLPLKTYALRRERVFIIIAGIFLGTLGIINILGLTRFIDLSFSIGNWTLPMVIPLGVLPYPVTFLCTDIISEFYGKKRANLIVLVGFLINAWIFFILWLAGILPPEVSLDPQTQLPALHHPEYAFFQVRLLTVSSIFASMIAYLIAQFLDVHLFHFWKQITKGKHLWLRNNGSTIISQFVDTIIIISIAYSFTNALPLCLEKPVFPQLINLALYSYSFKVIASLLDTIPCYILVYSLKSYFGLSKQTLTQETPLPQTIIFDDF